MNRQTASVFLGGSVEGSCIRKCYFNQRKEIHPSSRFTSRPSKLGDSIEKGAISAAAWMNFLLFFNL